MKVTINAQDLALQLLDLGAEITEKICVIAISTIKVEGGLNLPLLEKAGKASDARCEKAVGKLVAHFVGGNGSTQRPSARA